MATIRSINPATGEVIEEYQLIDTTRATLALEKAQAAFEVWWKTSVMQRANLIFNLSNILTKNRDRYARMITKEMGKPIKEALAEVDKCAWVCEYYAQNGPAFLISEPIFIESYKSFVRFDPLGVIMAIMPWNFPFWQVFRAAVPALLAGNVMVLKHASNVPGSSLLIEEIFKEAGFPEGVFQTLLISSSTALELIKNHIIKGVTLTGSSQAGAVVAKVASSQIKKSVLELGGSDPFVVFDDSDVQAAAKIAVKARMINTGQSCIAAKRFIVQRTIYDEFLDAFINNLKDLKMGDPLHDETSIGPMAREDLVADIKRQVDQSVKMGAKAVYTHQPPSEGFYFSPVVLTNISKDMPVWREETFGPAAPIMPFEDEDEALFLANDTEYGLGAAIWTSDEHRALRLASQIEAGSVAINDFVKSDPRLPFGGIKRSGYGRELSRYGLKEFVNIKSVVLHETDYE